MLPSVSNRKMTSAGCGIVEVDSGSGRRLRESAFACSGPGLYSIV